MAGGGDILSGAVEIMLEKNGKMVSIGSLAGVMANVNFVESVKIKIGLMGILQIEVALHPTLEQAIQLLRSGTLGIGFSVPKNTASKQSQSVNQAASSLLNISFNSIAIRLHYGALQSNWFKGYLVQPDVDISAQGINFTLKAFGMLFPSMRSMSPVNYQAGGKTKYQVIKELFGDDVTIYIDKHSKANAILAQPLNRNVVENQNHLQIARNILEENQCKFVMIGGGKSANQPQSQQLVKIFHVSESRPKNSDNSFYVDSTYVLYGQINPNARVFPLLAYSAPIQNILIGYTLGASVASSTSQKGTRGKKFTVPINTIDDYPKRGPVPGPPDGSSGGGVNTGTQNQTGQMGGFQDPSKVSHIIPTPGDLVNHVLNAVHDYVDKVFEYDLGSVGVVDLLPGRLIRVRVANIRELTGEYDLTEVEHTVNSSGVETRMHAVRTGGLISALSAGIEQVKGKVATKLSNTTTSTSTGLISQ
jgi:hypothetical protein